ncbi:MAG: tetratricopeptide repeat protein [Thermanaerothrix sp.]|uniref:tetratricopeptide repeat protein n=1 Tax=Thermanaerothrix sp. TaxID=2972675 RepID=UPI003C7A6D4C
MPNVTHCFAQVENLRKECRYPGAAPIFTTFWQQQPDPRVGWHLAFCQRQQGCLDQAKAVARKALELAPGDPYIQSELG